MQNVKSVTFIVPKSKNETASDISILTTPLSGLLILATMLKNKGFLIKFFDESIKKPNYEKFDSDYILINTMSATAKRAYELADYFKEKGKNVFIGGIHASFKPDEALEHCDKVVIGEGENVVFDLFDKNNKEKIIKGSPVKDLDGIPLPDYKIVEGLSKNPKIVSICSSRGCPHNCKFCSLKNIFGRKYRTVSNDKLINYLLEFNKIKTLCFDEPNFTADKKRVVEILNKMKENDIYPKYAVPSVSIDVAEDDKLLKLFSDVSQFNLLIGLESINQNTLNSFNKKQSVDEIIKAIKKIHDYGIGIQGSFIFGSDYDDKTVFQKTVDFCSETDIEFPIFCALTPYVGTDIRKEFEDTNRILTNNWDYYDGSHVVIRPKNMTPYELQDGIISSYENFYSTSKIFNHFKKREFLYGIETLYFSYLIKKILAKNQDYLEYLEKIDT